METLIEVLKSVVWYNGLEVDKWLEMKPNEYGSITFDEKMLGDGEEYYQLQVIWMICVELFGEYGSSPRCGWIDNVDGFYEFIKSILKDEVEG